MNIEEFRKLLRELEECTLDLERMITWGTAADLAGAKANRAEARQAVEQAWIDAGTKAEQYKADWYAAKSEFGTARAKLTVALRSAEQRELEALAELDETRVRCDEAIRLLHLLDRPEARHPDVVAFIDALQDSAP